MYKLMSSIVIVMQNANEGLDEYPGTRGRSISNEKYFVLYLQGCKM